MIFDPGAKFGFCGFGAFRPRGQRLHIVVLIFVGQNHVEIIIELPKALDSPHHSGGILRRGNPGNLHFADKGIRQRGLPLVEHGSGHLVDCRTFAALSGEVLLDNIEIAVNGHVLLPLGADKQNIQTFGRFWLGINVDNNDDILCHKITPSLCPRRGSLFLLC